MTAQYNPKTLAKTISYIAYHAPAEYGLFWDPDGTMPWKELYWALQEDPSLRFVRESSIRELIYLGLELPFVLEENLLRLRAGLEQPFYPLVDNVPEKLYFACRRKQYTTLLEHGIVRSNRSYVPVASNRELALRVGKRRDSSPFLIEVLAARASSEGEPVRWVGAELYLVESVPVRYLILPLIRAEEQGALTLRKKAETKPSRTVLPVSPGSFFVDAHQIEGHSSARKGGDKTGKKKGRKKDDWKREAKKERGKRSL
jgi:putative RNA 2'-phosphotransferase